MDLPAIEEAARLALAALRSGNVVTLSVQKNAQKPRPAGRRTRCAALGCRSWLKKKDDLCCSEGCLLTFAVDALLHLSRLGSVRVRVQHDR